VGDFDGNLRLAEEALAAAEQREPISWCFPSWRFSAIRRANLLERDAFVQAGVRSLDRLVARVGCGRPAARPR